MRTIRRLAFPITIVVAFWLFGTANKARADVGPNPSNGVSISSPGQSPTDIELTDEVVEMLISQSTCSVTAVFHLKNTGTQTTMKVGFPSSSWLVRTSLDNFRTWIDGAPVSDINDTKVSDTSAAPTQRDSYWKEWTMGFSPGQIREVKVAYESPLYRDKHNFTFCDSDWWSPELEDKMSSKDVQYILVTGSYWKGSIGQCKIIANLDGLNCHDNSFTFNLKPSAQSDRQAVWEWSNFEPKQNLHIGLLPYSQKKLIAELETIYKTHPADPYAANFLGSRYAGLGDLPKQLLLYKDYILKNHTEIAGWEVDNPYPRNDPNKLLSVYWMIIAWANNTDKCHLEDDARVLAPVAKLCLQKSIECQRVKYRVNNTQVDAWFDKYAGSK
jgi:hypothetical protein